MARLAGVHPATVSRALNPQSRSLVNAETVNRVCQAAEELDYQPNFSARSLKTSQSMTVGVIVPDLGDPAYPPVLRGIEDRLADAGYVALIGNTDGDQGREQRVFDRMQRRYVDAFIVASQRRPSRLAAQSAHLGKPVVIVGRPPDGLSLSTVAFDERAGSRRAVDHLRSLGHERVGYIASASTSPDAAQRASEVASALEEAGLDARLAREASLPSESEGFRCAGELLAQRVTAVIAGSSLLSLGTLKACQFAGLACPDELSIVGFDDNGLISLLAPQLTSLHVDGRYLGSEAARLAIERLTEPEAASKSVLLTPEMTIRNSTAPPPLAPPS